MADLDRRNALTWNRILYNRHVGKFFRQRWAALGAYLKNEHHVGSVYTLDGLRAIAILLVLCHHGPREFYYNNLWWPPPTLLQIFEPLAQNGRLGVDLFFVLSGFLISSQLIRFYEGCKPWPQLWRFFANRIFRIIPAFYALLLIIQFVLPHICPVPPQGILVHGLSYPDIPKFIAMQYGFMQDFFGRPFLPIFWTLGVEEKFYLLSPLLVGGVYWLARKNRRAGWLTLAGLILIPLLLRGVYMLRFSDASMQEHYGPFRLTEFHLRGDGILVGIACAFLHHWYRETALFRHPRSGPLLMGLGSLAVCVFLFTLPLLGPYSKPLMLFSNLGVALAFGLVMLGALGIPNHKAGWLGSRPLFFIARVSYSLYLTHVLWYKALSDMVARWFHATSWPVPETTTSLAFIVYMLAYFSVSIGMAALYFYAVEKPFLLLKDRWFRDRTPQSAPVSVLPPAEPEARRELG